MGRPLRVGLDARISTHDQHTLALQLDVLRTSAVQRSWSVVIEVTEIGLGAIQRPQRERLMHAARRRTIDAILMWRLNRWGRSVADLPWPLGELEDLGVGFASLTEALDLTTPTGRAMAGARSVGGV